MSSASTDSPAKIWWSNGLFFVGTHIAAGFGVYSRPYYTVHPATLILTVILWQAASFGITVGYHRLYSHRAFRAGLGVRIVLAALLGSSAFQGSIKWWCLRHRLHHRFTDDPVHDPYAATRGLLWSHMGWIFFKPKYDKMVLIDRQDLDNDIVVRLQHEYYVPLAILTGFVLPTALGFLWGDAWAAFIYASLVARLLIWHCTFLINSLAHWDGLQPYSDENTSRTNTILALLTCGEGNHNFHAFPQDFRSGPHPHDWDPSKWLILVLRRFGFAWALRTAREKDVSEALTYMNAKEHCASDSDNSGSSYESEETSSDSASPTEYEVWNAETVHEYVSKPRTARCVLVLGGYVVDATAYLGEHPGGAALLRKYSVRAPVEGAAQEEKVEELWRQADWAFNGGLNQHSRAAKKCMQELRIARYQQ